MKLRYYAHTLDGSQPELMIQGRTISDWARQIGSTPFYIYDSSIIQKKVQELRAHLPKKVKIHYAIKANPNSEILNILADLVDGFDLASSGELKRALQTSMSTQHMSFAGPGKTDTDLAEAIQAKVLLHVESLGEIQRCLALSKKLQHPPRIALRINPDYDMKSSGMKMGGGSKQFGIDAEQIPEIISSLQNNKCAVEGLHIFAGSQNLDAQIICQTLDSAFNLLDRFQNHLATELRSFNFGGGLGIPYFEKDSEIDLEHVGVHLSKLIQNFEKKFPNAEPVIELGRFLVGECGIFVSRVVDKKVSRGQTFIILDGGMNCHLAATGNLGQVLKRPFPIKVLNRLTDFPLEAVNIVGPLCTPLDSFGNQVMLNTCAVGDLVGIFQSGAYGFTASPMHFLSQSLATEIVV